MTDLYIEQATTAFQQMWTGGGQMSATIPQIHDVIQALAGRLKVTENALQSAVQRMDGQDVIIGKLRDEIMRLQASTEASTRRLDTIEGESGLLSKSELFSEVRQMPEVDSIRSIREQLMNLHQRVGESNSDLSERQRVLEERLPDVVDRTVNETNRQLKAQLTRLEEEQQNSIQRLTSSIAKVNTALAESQAQSTRDLRGARELLESQLRDVKEGAHQDLEVSFSEVLSHLKQQAHFVDAMQQDMRRHQDTALTQDQVELLREEMRSVRGDMDRAQFRLHEAYSQMMSLARTSSSSGASGSVNNHPATTQPMMHVDRTSATFVTTVNNSTVEEHVVSSRNATSSPAGASWSAMAAPSAAFLETSLEPIRKELTHLQRTIVPALSNAIQGQQEVTDGLVVMHKRAQGMLTSLMSCIGLRDRLDELFSSLESMDAAHVLLMLRKGFDAVYPPHVLAQRGVAGGASLTTSAAKQQLHVDHQPLASSRHPTPSHSTTFDASTPIHSASTHYPSPAVGGGNRPASSRAGTPHVALGGSHQHTPLHYRGGGGSVLHDAPSLNSSASSRGGGGLRATFQLGVDVGDGPDGHGARIMAVLDGSVAQRCGLRFSEVVLQVNGQQVHNSNHFAALMRSETESAMHNAHQRRAIISLTVAQYQEGGSDLRNTRVVDVPLLD